MENQSRNSNTALWVIVTVLACILTGTIVFAFSYAEQRKKLYEVKDAMCDTTHIAEIPIATIDEVVEYREEMRKDAFLDSVYMHMPEVALRAILQKYGTEISGFDIAEEYLRNPEENNDVQLGARIQKEITIKQDSIKADSSKL